MKEKKEYLVLRTILSEDMKKTRKELGLTQSQMAAKLKLDVRSYCNIESGRSLCGTLALLLYFSKLCPDVEMLLERIRRERKSEESKE